MTYVTALGVDGWAPRDDNGGMNTTQDLIHDNMARAVRCAAYAENGRAADPDRLREISRTAVWLAYMWAHGHGSPVADLFWANDIAGRGPFIGGWR